MWLTGNSRFPFLSCIDRSITSCFPLSPVLEVDDMGSLQACLQEVSQFQVLGCWSGLWAAILHSCWQRLHRQTYRDKERHSKTRMALSRAQTSAKAQQFPLVLTHRYHQPTYVCFFTSGSRHYPLRNVWTCWKTPYLAMLKRFFKHHWICSFIWIRTKITDKLVFLSSAGLYEKSFMVRHRFIGLKFCCAGL